MPVVSSAGAAAAASAAIAANNTRVICHGFASSFSIWVNASLASFTGVVLGLLMWVLIKCAHEDGFPWAMKLGIYITFGACVLFAFALPAVFVMWLCGALP